MKRLGVAAAVLMTVVGCAAPVGETNLDLHQRAQLPDGTSLALSGFEVSAKDSGRRTGPQKVVGDEVKVGVQVANAGKVIRAADVTMRFTYTDPGGRDVTPREVSSSTNSIPQGGSDKISKTYRVAAVPELFRAKHLRVVVEVQGYPSVTFSGRNP